MKRIIIASITLLMAAGSFATTRQKNADIVCGPYVQCVTETGFTVVWSTDVDAVAWVEVAPDDGTHFYNKDRDKFYDGRGHGILPIGKIHKIEVDGLEPGKNYRYRLMYKGVVSYNGSGDVKYSKTKGTDVYRGQPYRVATFRKDYDTLRFDVYNDIHGKDSLFNMLLSQSQGVCDFVFLNGDMTSNISNHEMIADMYLGTAARHLKGSTPLFVSRGNHELRGKDATRWFDYFTTPTGAPYYSFKIGKFFFIVLDACEDKPDNDIEYSGIVASSQYLNRQEQWLKKELATEECRNSEVRIAICHVQPETKGWYGNAQMCEKLIPHLNEAGIDVMLCGHIHTWRAAEPDGSLSNAEFPVICNPNMQRMEVSATNETIEINTFCTKGNRTNTYTVKLK